MHITIKQTSEYKAKKRSAPRSTPLYFFSLLILFLGKLSNTLFILEFTDKQMIVTLCHNITV